MLGLIALEYLQEFTGETELRRRAVGAKATSPAGGTVAVVQPPAEPQTPLNSLRAVSSTPGSSVMSAARSGISKSKFHLLWIFHKNSFWS